MMIDDEMTEIEIKTKDVITETGMTMMMNSAENSVTGDMTSVTMTGEETIVMTMLTGDERTELTETDAIEMMIVETLGTMTGESTGVIEMTTFDEMSGTEGTEMMIDDVTEMMTLTGDVKIETGDKTTIAMMTGMTEETETRISEDNSETGEIGIEMMREDERIETVEIAKEMMNEGERTEIPAATTETEMWMPAERGERETLTTIETPLSSGELRMRTAEFWMLNKMSLCDREMKTRMS